MLSFTLFIISVTLRYMPSNLNVTFQFPSLDTGVLAWVQYEVLLELYIYLKQYTPHIYIYIYVCVSVCVLCVCEWVCVHAHTHSLVCFIWLLYFLIHEILNNETDMKKWDNSFFWILFEYFSWFKRNAFKTIIYPHHI